MRRRVSSAKMRKGAAALALAAGMAVGASPCASAEDLAWKYEGTPQAEVVGVDASESPALAVPGAVGAAGASAEIDARWSCEQFLANLTYRFKRFFTLILR